MPIDVQYLDAHTYSIKEISFAKDVSGQMLRYKILVYDWKIRDVLYNNGSSVEAVPFAETKISFEEFFVFNKSYFGKIAHVPYGLLTYPQKTFIEELAPQQKQSTL